MLIALAVIASSAVPFIYVSACSNGREHGACALCLGFCVDGAEEE